MSIVGDRKEGVDCSNPQDDVPSRFVVAEGAFEGLRLKGLDETIMVLRNGLPAKYPKATYPDSPNWPWTRNLPSVCSWSMDLLASPL